MQDQITSNVFMIRPVNFAFNVETANSNKFQENNTLQNEEINKEAQANFDEFVEQLSLRGVNVKVFEDTKNPFTPDSIFPNNWISLHHSGKLILYPLEAPNRRLERRKDIVDYLSKQYNVAEVIDLSDFENTEKYLEGTGSLVLDRIHRIAYACLSSRTNTDVLEAWKTKMNGYKLVTFNAFDKKQQVVYHTNVMMCMGDSFCVICLDSILDLDERLKVKNRIESSGKEVIEISLDQMHNFAGNMLLLKNSQGHKILVMSQKAFDSLLPIQQQKLDEKAEILAVKLGVIETLGGGSARCMIAEIHLPIR